MKQEWLRAGPSIEELVLEMKDQRRERKSKVAIVMPTMNNAKMLENHVNELTKQTFQDFDILIIYGENDNFIDGDGSSILHVREKGNNGSAGSYYIGQKIALRDDYPLIVHADDDCLPVSHDLLEKLVNSLENGDDVVLPLVSYGDSKPKKSGIINHYGAFKNTVLRKTGLMFLPMWWGPDDMELFARMRKTGFRTGHLDVKAWHPYFTFTFIEKMTKTYHYRRGFIQQAFLTNNYYKALWIIIYNLLTGVGALSLGKTGHAKVIFTAIWDASGMKFFKVEGHDQKAKHRKLEDHSLSLNDIDKSGYDVVIENDSTKKIPRDLLEFFGKKILIVKGDEMHWTATYLPIMVVARSTDIIFQDRLYKLTDERSSFSIILSIVFCIVSAPFVALGSIIFFIRAFLTRMYGGIKSDGYGI